MFVINRRFRNFPLRIATREAQAKWSASETSKAIPLAKNTAILYKRKF